MPLNQPGETLVTYGTYTGDNAVNRAIPHSLHRTPKLVILVMAGGVVIYTIFNALGEIHYQQAAVSSGDHAVTAPTNTNFYVGNAASQQQSANDNLVVYHWTAIG